MAHYGKNNQYTLLLGDHRKHKQNKTQFMRFLKGDFISFKLLSIRLHLQHISAGGVFSGQYALLLITFIAQFHTKKP